MNNFFIAEPRVRFSSQSPLGPRFGQPYLMLCVADDFIWAEGSGGIAILGHVPGMNHYIDKERHKRSLANWMVIPA